MTKCPKCLHEWEYKGKAKWITCPSCRALFKNPDWKEPEKVIVK